MRVIIVRPHPSDRAVVLASAGPDVSDVMGLVREARWDQQRRAYVLSAELLPRLIATAEGCGVHVVDETQSPVDLAPRWTPEPRPGDQDDVNARGIAAVRAALKAARESM